MFVICHWKKVWWRYSLGGCVHHPACMVRHHTRPCVSLNLNVTMMLNLDGLSRCGALTHLLPMMITIEDRGLSDVVSAKYVSTGCINDGSTIDQQRINNESTTDQQRINKGYMIYQQKCSMCHILLAVLNVIKNRDEIVWVNHKVSFFFASSVASVLE